MRSSNKNKLLHFFLLLKIIVRVVCPTIGELARCEDELYLEFKNVRPLDDFVHAFLNIKYETVFWDETTDTNEEIFRGNNVLKVSAKSYYQDLYNTALELGIPELLTPKDFCSTNHGREEEDCISAIAAIGCEANIDGPKCFEKMYFTWKQKNEDPLFGTRNLSNEQLLEAIYKGSSEFRNLSDEDLFKAFSEKEDIINKLSDEILLEDHYRENYKYDFIHDPYFSRLVFDDINLRHARLNIYGISNVSYRTVCEEYLRRKIFPKIFDNLYAMNISEKLQNSSWDVTNFKSREDFCEKYLSGEL